ncbi:DUF2855 family protein [Pyxidicoccus parkwayensis]|uniref:DUF2855 family protein n=1 Tax=Pyxidicoccus parkwayensis TaxID=2813578 RepID=UPI00353062E1
MVRIECWYRRRRARPPSGSRTPIARGANARSWFGLTSPGSVAFLERLGLYDRLVTYDAIPSLAAAPSVLVDIAGNPEVIHALGERLERVIIVGKAHWDAASGFGGGGGRPKREAFFAPGRIARRSADWGGDQLRERVSESWSAFLAIMRDAVRIDLRHGADGALAAYREAVAGSADPRSGVLIAIP